MKNIVTLLIGGLLSCNPLNAAPPVELKTGDLLFQESCGGDVGKAIKGVTQSADDYQFTHVGIVWIDGKDTLVIEATKPTVAITRLQEYLYPPDERECPPLSVAGRLKDTYQPLIPQAIEEAKKLVGKEYDYAFNLGDDTYYCSELIYEIFRKANRGTAVFQLNTMTFKSKETGGFMPEWIEYYKKLGKSVPEGEQGINPGAMSRSDAIKIIGKYD